MQLTPPLNSMEVMGLRLEKEYDISFYEDPPDEQIKGY